MQLPAGGVQRTVLGFVYINVGVSGAVGRRLPTGPRNESQVVILQHHSKDESQDVMLQHSRRCETCSTT